MRRHRHTVRRRGATRPAGGPAALAAITALVAVTVACGSDGDGLAGVTGPADIEPGHAVRPIPDGVEPLLPPGQDVDDADGADGADGEREDVGLFDPEDGWSEALGRVEIPDQPGSGVVLVDGDRIELFVECRGGPRADEPTDGVAFELDVVAVDIAAGAIGFEIRRTVGSFSGGSRFAEDEYLYVFRESGVGALGWMVTPDGETVEPRNWPLASGPFVRIDRSGAFSVEASVDHPLQGAFTAVTFALGGRCQDGWED